MLEKIYKSQAVKLFCGDKLKIKGRKVEILPE